MTTDQVEPPVQADALLDIQQLREDVAYWRRQHDAVMEDWKADLAQLTPSRSPERDDRYRRALEGLLRFYDPGTGAVVGKVGRDLLSDAFAEALKATLAKGVGP